MSTLPKWDADREATLVGLVGSDTDVEITNDAVDAAALALETSKRSVASKLRRMEYTVESSIKERKKSFSDAEEAELRGFVEGNSGSYTYAEIAAASLAGAHSPKAIQGKLLSMELTAHVKATPKQEIAKKYSDAEELQFIELAEAGSFMEDIAAALGKPLNSVRGKALSLNRQRGLDIPKQRESAAKTQTDPLAALGDLAELTVAEIADSIEKTERGVKTMLTHRGVNAKDYKGAAKAAKIAEKKTS
tara:strand:+ start:67 stop:810 length:744 start_codon:yes stop_codon:yes gene_type:complete